MATAVGVNADITFLAEHNVKADRWALSIGQALINTTGFDSGGYEDNTAGLKSGRWSVSGHMEFNQATSSPGIDAATQAGGAVTFQIAPGCTVAVDCVVSDISIGADVNNDERITYSGATSGPAVETWDESA